MSLISKRALLLGALVAVCMPAMAHADSEGPYATFDIKLENTAVDSEVHPMVTAPITKDKVQFHIINNTGKALFFSNGQTKDYIPLVSNSTVTTPYMAGQEYQVVDDAGHTVAKWHLDQPKVSTPAMASATPSQFADWGNTLQQVIANQKVSYQEPASNADAHPAKASHGMSHHAKSHYQNKPASRTSQVIRGYW